MTAPDPKWSDFAKYLRAEHLEGKAATLTISAIVVEEVYSKRDKCKRPAPVLYFEGRKIGLVLSDINQATLCRLFGNSMRACVGQRITLRPMTLQVAGKDTTPIRLEPAPADDKAKTRSPVEQVGLAERF